ncbi:MAG: hypothetical protein ACP5VQ_07630 [Phycisphaerae bacterium]
MAKREQFRFFTLFRRITAVMDDDALVLLEHQYTKDRIRRIPFDQVDYILHWVGPATARLLGLMSLTLLLLIAGLATLSNMRHDNSFSEGFAAVVLLLAAFTAVLFFIALERGRRHVVVSRAGSKVHLSGIMRAEKFQRLLADMTTRTHEVQAKLTLTAAAAANPTELPPPENPISAVSTVTATEPNHGELDK